jgi:hypothetical protein
MENPTKAAHRPAHDTVQRHEAEKGNKATEVANKAAEKSQDRMKRDEDERGPFSK